MSIPSMGENKMSYLIYTFVLLLYYFQIIIITICWTTVQKKKSFENSECLGENSKKLLTCDLSFFKNRISLEMRCRALLGCNGQKLSLLQLLLFRCWYEKQAFAMCAKKSYLSKVT